jgi:hypothetical protein
MKTMKRLIYFSATILLIATFYSCEKEDALLDDSFDLKKSLEYPVISEPVSSEGITPYIIPGENKGGNRTCEEVGVAFDTEFALCGDKVDYEDGSFESDFPMGLNVSVDGSFVSFEASGCIMIEDKAYKVGAVIVKGGREANVYYYPNGTLSDSNLAAPVNASGRAAGLSNLTFCFVECVEEDIYIAAKAAVRRINPNTGVNEWYWGLSSGDSYPFTPFWCDRLGINEFSDGDVYDLVSMYPVKDIILGKITVNEVDKHLVITVDAFEGVTLHDTYIYAGSYDGFLNSVPEGDKCPDYVNNWTAKEENTVGSTVTFIIPVN